MRLTKRSEEGGLRVTPEHAVWALRLLVEAGLVKGADVPHRKLPDDASPTVRRVYEGFVLLLRCKHLHTPGAATPFTWSFAACWCGVDSRTARDAMRYLLQEGFVQEAGAWQCRGREMKLFLPCEVKHGA